MDLEAQAIGIGVLHAKTPRGVCFRKSWRVGDSRLLLLRLGLFPILSSATFDGEKPPALAVRPCSALEVQRGYTEWEVGDVAAAA